MGSKDQYDRTSAGCKDRVIEKLTVTAPLSAINDELIMELSSLIKASPGNAELCFFIRDEDGLMHVNLMSRTLKIAVHKELVNYLKASQCWTIK